MPLDDAALNLLFRDARTHNKWTDQPVTDDELRAVFELQKMAPTSANASPARFLFLRTQEAKEKLRPALSPGNVDKTMAAPVTVIVAHDPHFYDHLPRLFPHADAKSWFSSNYDLAQETAFRNGTLQAAYLMIAARALGYDCGPMSGFSNEGVDAAFFEGANIKSNFICCIGHGTDDNLFERSPRLTFEQANRIV